MRDSATLNEALPERIRGLVDLSRNLSWSWDRDARALFRAIDESLWHRTRHNPVEVLRRISDERLNELAGDPAFVEPYDQVLARFRHHQSRTDTWYQTAYPDLAGRPIAYFCAEFGLHNSVPIDSGGLGILAGDHVKAASDLGVPLVAVGLFYTKGYFDQQIRIDGWQENAAEVFDVNTTPLERVRNPDGSVFLESLGMCGRRTHVAAWRMQVGRVPVYLLDTDLEQNSADDRALTHTLYAPGPNVRLRQEWVLGVAGVRLLRMLGIEPAVWHANEGHAAFMLVERLREFCVQDVPLAEAVRRVRATSVFTTHTPVPAGHDVFTGEQLHECVGPLCGEMKVEHEAFMALGRHPALGNGRFHMTAMAVRLSASVNGVSLPHGEVTRSMWRSLWPDRDPSAVPIRHVTNGAHLSTWMARGMHEILDHHLGAGWEERVDDAHLWDGVLTIDDECLWEFRETKKRRLLEFMIEEARARWRDEWKKETAHIVGAGTLLTVDALTIGFARRFATYKRADLVFRDAERLRRLVTDPRRPVQIIFAGKAHPADQQGKEMLQRVYGFTRDPAFEGRIAFLEDYDKHVAHRLVEGVDLWLNLPRVPMEACGTSGMKAALNAVPQLGTLDGWWAEGYNGRNGWAVPRPAYETDPDEWDAGEVYRLLEHEIVPLYYERDRRGVSAGWVDRMRHALHAGGRHFTARRMVQQYVREYYVPALRGEVQDDPPAA